jgi:hypothetical protein
MENTNQKILVTWYDYDSELHERECDTMWAAMELSKHLKDAANITVDIINGDIVYVGAMGACVVHNDKLPNGDDYAWTKRRGDKKWRGRR